MKGSTLYMINNHEGRGRDIIDTIVRPNPRMYYYAYSTPHAFSAFSHTIGFCFDRALWFPGACVGLIGKHTPLITRYLAISLQAVFLLALSLWRSLSFRRDSHKLKRLTHSELSRLFYTERTDESCIEATTVTSNCRLTTALLGDAWVFFLEKKPTCCPPTRSKFTNVLV